MKFSTPPSAPAQVGTPAAYIATDHQHHYQQQQQNQHQHQQQNQHQHQQQNQHQHQQQQQQQQSQQQQQPQSPLQHHPTAPHPRQHQQAYLRSPHNLQSHFQQHLQIQQSPLPQQSRQLLQPVNPHPNLSQGHIQPHSYPHPQPQSHRQVYSQPHSQSQPLVPSHSRPQPQPQSQPQPSLGPQSNNNIQPLHLDNRHSPSSSPYDPNQNSLDQFPDLGDMALPDLLNAISPQIDDDFRLRAPQAYEALLNQVARPHDLSASSHSVRGPVQQPHLPHSHPDMITILEQVVSASNSPRHSSEQAHHPTVPIHDAVFAISQDISQPPHPHSPTSGSSMQSLQYANPAAPPTDATAAAAAAATTAPPATGVAPKNARVASQSRRRHSHAAQNVKPKVGEKRSKSRMKDSPLQRPTVKMEVSPASSASGMASVPPYTANHNASGVLSATQQGSPGMSAAGPGGVKSMLPHSSLDAQQQMGVPLGVVPDGQGGRDMNGVQMAGVQMGMTTNGIDTGGDEEMGTKEEINQEHMDPGMSFDGAEEDVEVKKAMRAERNRQSAAASRERKKHHIRELERRVSILSQENAELQCEQLQVIRERIEKERSLLQENKELKRKVVFKDMEISKLSQELKNLKTEPEETTLKRPNTWDASEWGKKSWSGRKR